MQHLETFAARDARVAAFVRDLVAAAGRPPVTPGTQVDLEETYLELVEDVPSWKLHRPLLFGPFDPIRVLELLAAEASRTVAEIAADPSAPEREVAAALAAAALADSSPDDPDAVALWRRIGPAYQVPLLRTSADDGWFTRLWRRSRSLAA